jgi:hypothetical protein
MLVFSKTCGASADHAMPPAPANAHPASKFKMERRVNGIIIPYDQRLKNWPGLNDILRRKEAFYQKYAL